MVCSVFAHIVLTSASKLVAIRLGLIPLELLWGSRVEEFKLTHLDAPTNNIKNPMESGVPFGTHVSSGGDTEKSSIGALR